MRQLAADASTACVLPYLIAIKKTGRRYTKLRCSTSKKISTANKAAVVSANITNEAPRLAIHAESSDSEILLTADEAPSRRLAQAASADSLAVAIALNTALAHGRAPLPVGAQSSS